MMKKCSFFYILSILVFIFSIWLLINRYIDFTNRDAYKINKEICEKRIQQDTFAGIITCTFKDDCNKATFTFVVNHRKYTNIIDNYEFERQIIEGDSIVKKKGEAKFYIYPKNNPDTVIILEFDCSVWDK